MLRNRFLTAQAAALAFTIVLGGCGGSGGSPIVSTPTPTPTPASYTKIVDMSGDRTFQTAGVQYSVSAPVTGFTNGSTQALGSGVAVAYLAASDSYKLTASDGSTVTFTPADVIAPPPTLPNTQQWSKANGTTRDTFSLTVPTGSGVALSYTVVGSWAHSEGPNSTMRLAVGGVPTIASDMPRTGSATYSVATGGSAVQGGAVYSLSGNSSATFTANFGNNSVATSLTLGGTMPANPTVHAFGTFDGTGTISATGPGFTGTFAGNGATGAFSGAFFGPKALEMGYNWFLNSGAPGTVGSIFSAVGTVAGAKQ